jgi:hypothetical protein
MAKPDLQKTYSKPSTGVSYRDDGKLGLALNTLKAATNDTTAATAGVPIGGLYYITSTGVVHVRLS